MRPYLSEEEGSGLRYVVYLADCRSMDKVLQSGSVDLVMTSPPYNIGKEYDEDLSHGEYLDFLREWVRLVDKVVNENGAFWLNLGFYKTADGRQYIPWEYECVPIIDEFTDFKLIQQVIWHYGAGISSKRRLSPRKETWLFYVKDLGNYVFNLDDVRVPHKYPNQRKGGKLKVNPLGKNPGDVWSIPKVTSGAGRSSPERTEHPAQFPEALAATIVRLSSNPGDLVLDPFLGSGTTMKVARDLRRSCIGFEIEKRYVDDIIADRVFEGYTHQAKLSA